jgi:hypothetical protein
MKALREAYAAAHYRVLLDGGCAIVRIGQPVPAPVQAVLDAHGATRAAFLTACNPRSRPLAQERNAQRQRTLLAALARLGTACVPGVGEDPQQRWPPERSVLAIGLARERARALAASFGQYAWVELVAGAPARLVYTAHWRRR